MRPGTDEDRFYRAWAAGRGLSEFRVSVGESDLQIFADRNLSAEAETAVRRARRDIEMYAAANDEFIKTWEPLAARPGAPDPVRRMCAAAATYGVGPMAAVAGTVSELVGRALLQYSAQVIVENGGDIFYRTTEPPVFGMFAGQESPFTGRLKFRPAGLAEAGVCTSSGTVGHSTSFGRADAVVAVARDTSLADAAATAIGNSIRSEDDIQRAVDIEKERGILDGLLVACGKALGAWGSIEVDEGA